ncbi:hypothetical protein HMF7854_06780 [Sphingomonas ginkgonis]|uniref:CBM-cenC domain-containing protein n=1 Tax=Sphingomonas ginkgonis TaxID=2315330 RepID=A0A3R9X7F9_9SPHN|nr:hypothetical protein HMF7854_06780 [Sphingomonas ginkgonis]
MEHAKEGFSRAAKKLWNELVVCDSLPVLEASEGGCMFRHILAAMAVTFSAPTLAQNTAPSSPAPSGLNQKLINVPGTSWNVYGPNQSTKRLETDGPKGYPAIRATIARRGTNAWDSGATSLVPKPVAAGDAILVAVYLRAPELKDGETLEISLVGATGATAPYPAIAGEKAMLTNQWKVFFASGKAPQAFAANGVQATVHLAGAKQVVDLGPVQVYDFGQGFDLSRLPRN